MEKQQLRSSIDDNYKWDLTSIYKNDEEFNKDLEKAKKEIKKVVEFKDLLTSSKRLLDYIEYDEKTERLLSKF